MKKQLSNNAEANDDKTSTETETSVATNLTVKLPATKTNQSDTRDSKPADQLQKRNSWIYNKYWKSEKTSRIKVGR